MTHRTKLEDVKELVLSAGIQNLAVRHATHIQEQAKYLSTDVEALVQYARGTHALGGSMVRRAERVAASLWATAMDFNKLRWEPGTPECEANVDNLISGVEAENAGHIGVVLAAAWTRARVESGLPVSAFGLAALSGLARDYVTALLHDGVIEGTRSHKKWEVSAAAAYKWLTSRGMKLDCP